VAYLNHDIADAMRAGLLREEDLPQRVLSVLGESHSQRVNTLVCDIVDASWAATGLLGEGEQPAIRMSQAVAAATDELRDFMFERVYLWEGRAQEAAHARQVVRLLFEHYVAQPNEVNSDFTRAEDLASRRAADYIAGMTDLFALREAERLGFRS
jgi:dGTPase